ncbi:MAG TPA: hypothetical protein DC049_08590 [Spirochaetia bacterium]|nr:hypothetical protein [Spirochaetia bacterium]
MFMLLGDFVSYLEEQNVSVPFEAHLIHLENYLHEYLETYQSHIHETVQDFFSYLKNGGKQDD